MDLGKAPRAGCCTLYFLSMTETTHACPPEDSGITPCCDRTPFELPWTDRITLHPDLVTCGGPSDQVGR